MKLRWTDNILFLITPLSQKSFFSTNLAFFSFYARFARRKSRKSDENPKPGLTTAEFLILMKTCRNFADFLENEGMFWNGILWTFVIWEYLEIWWIFESNFRILKLESLQNWDARPGLLDRGAEGSDKSDTEKRRGSWSVRLSDRVAMATVRRTLSYDGFWSNCLTFIQLKSNSNLVAQIQLKSNFCQFFSRFSSNFRHLI